MAREVAVRVLTFLLPLGSGCVTEAVRTGPLGDAVPATRFGFPVADLSVISGRVGVDHDRATGEGLAADAICTDYAGRGFPNCYNEHHGTDYLLDGGFDAMDAGSVEVVAAYEGQVIQTVDGHYDRCHVYRGEVTCDGNPMIANSVVIQHPDGLISKYWHLMKDSVLVEVGDDVACGDPLGRIGSSGNSSLPHLHFQVERALDEWVDPYAGPFSQSESLWQEQGPEYGLPEAGCTSR